MSDTNKKDRIDSRTRIMDLFFRMYFGERINTESASKYYNVGIKAIQNDLRIIKTALESNVPEWSIIFDSEDKTHRIETESKVSISVAVAILKMIIGTRAFSQSELNAIREKIFELVNSGQKKQIQRLTTTTVNKYYPVKSPDDMLERIGKFSKWILNQKAITYTYNSSRTDSDPNEEFTGIPINMYFDRNYYYVMMYLDTDDSKAENPRVFRVDRFNFPVVEKCKQIHLPFDKKVDEWEMLRKTFLLKMGNDVHYKFRYWYYPQTALDRLPGSRVTKVFPDNSVQIEGEIFSEGALLWLFSQGEHIKVLYPPTLVEAVKGQLHRALKLYEED